MITPILFFKKNTKKPNKLQNIIRFYGNLKYEQTYSIFKKMENSQPLRKIILHIF